MAITAALPHGQDMSAVTKRKPKPKPRKASGLTLEQRIASLESVVGAHGRKLAASFVIDPVPAIAECMRRLDALESRASLRDKSHDEPVSNAGEAIGQHFRIVGEASRWRRFLNFMGAA